MKRGQVFVRARFDDGRVGPADVLDLDDDSFRAFVVDCLIRLGAGNPRDDLDVTGSTVFYSVRPGVAREGGA